MVSKIDIKILSQVYYTLQHSIFFYKSQFTKDRTFGTIQIA